MKRFFLLLIFTSLTMSHLQGMNKTQATPLAKIKIAVRVSCVNFLYKTINKTVTVSPQATIGELRTTLSDILRSPQDCISGCGGIRWCSNAAFKNAVEQIGAPTIIKDHESEVWDDKETVEAAFKRNKCDPQHGLSFALDEPEYNE